MKFVFEAKASDYDLAAEQEILLRHVSNRKRNWTRAVILCAATVVLCVLIVVFRHKDMTEAVQVAALVVGVILFPAGLSGLYERQPQGVSQAALPWAEGSDLRRPE